MKNIIVCFCFLLLSSSLYAQSNKVPSDEIVEPQFPIKDPQAASGLIKGFTHIVLRPGFSGKVDTTEVFFIRYYPSGYLASAETYDYARARKTDSKATFSIKSRLTNGSRFTYEYDSRGNITARRMYSIAAENSQEAMMEALFVILQQEKEAQFLRSLQGNRTASEEEMERHQDAIKKRAKIVIDSLSAANVSETAHLSTEEITTYDRNDNPVHTSDHLSKNSTRYFYTYYPDGRVKVQRSHYNSTANSWLYYSTKERHFTYDSKGRVTGITTYRAEHDSGDIVSVRNMGARDLTHYNKKGLPDTITSLTGSGVGSMQIITYTDTLPKTITIIELANGRRDTARHTVYSYRGMNSMEARHLQYNRGRRMSTNREETFYASHQLPVEVRKYQGGPDFDNEVLTQQELLFYGLDIDKQTEKRRLTQVETRESRPLNPAITTMQEPVLSIPPDEAKPVRSIPQAQTKPRDIFLYVERMPAFPGNSLAQYLKANTRPVNDKIEGNVTVKFAVNADGTISEEQIVKSLCKLCDQEALRVVRSMPKWIPGMQNGRLVDVWYTIDIPIKGLQK